MHKKKNKEEGIALALGGGGVRACIYIGFYEVLKKNKINITHITGTSMGAIIGAAMALGLPPEKIRDFARKYSSLNFFSLKNFAYFDEGLVKRTQVSKIIAELFGDKTFADTIIPFACTAVDLEMRDEVILKEGSLAKAVEASSAYPVIFPPLFYKSKYLIDGGILDSVPAEAARELGAKNLLAVKIKTNIVRQYIAGQVYLKHYKQEGQEGEEPGFADKLKELLKKVKKFPKKKRNDVTLLVDILLESISIASEKNMNENLRKAKPELLLEPVVDISLLDFSKLDEAIDLGRELAEKSLPKIKKLLFKAKSG
jgi:NTE family protein